MGDQAMDPCECISQEFAVRRLLSLLRQTQSYCLDTHCLEELNHPESDATSENFLLMTLVMAFAMIIYFLRPRSSRQNVHDQKVPSNNQGPQPPPNAPIN
ncbi:small integral membrane protein 14 [Arctopsyche grandis]|uniref:small integral membrane protein 14 n=1 Tax=Arctopsyche grandis TaxID=121162 RepID=UPI00406D7045